MSTADTNLSNHANLGTLISYEIPTRTYNAQRVREAFLARGLEGTLIPSPPKSAEAFTRAMAHLKARGENPDSRMVDGARREALDPGFTVHVRKIDTKGSGDERKIIYSLCRANAKEKTADAICEQTVEFSENGVTFTEDYLQTEIAEAIGDFSMNPTDADVRAKVVKLLDSWQTLNVKGRTVMFVPDVFRESVFGMRDLLREIGARCSVIDVARSEANLDEMVRAFADTTDAQIADLLAEVAALDETGKARQGTYAKKLSSLSALRNQCEFFAGVLECSAADMLAKLATVEVEIKARTQVAIRVPVSLSLKPSQAQPASPQADASEPADSKSNVG